MPKGKWRLLWVFPVGILADSAPVEFAEAIGGPDSARVLVNSMTATEFCLEEIGAIFYGGRMDDMG